MAKARPAATRVALTISQIQEGVGAELFSLCQSITADGELSEAEIQALIQWIDDNRSFDLPGISYLANLMDRIVADGRITLDEQKELIEAIEKTLPPDARKEAKCARRESEKQRKAESKAAQQRAKELERQREMRRWPEDEFDFMVAGVQFEGRHRHIERHVEVNDEVELLREPDNPKDDCAVAVLHCGQHVGYVPRNDSEDVTGCIQDGGYYTATVKKVLTGGRYPIPVVVVRFFRLDQLEDIKDLNPTPCPSSKVVFKCRPWWKFW